jgi:hypothetical protein
MLQHAMGRIPRRSIIVEQSFKKKPAIDMMGRHYTDAVMN